MKQACTLLLFSTLSVFAADEVLVEAESFAHHGGWKLDTQFIEIMGSPYLLAHGLGEPVADAKTTVTFPSTGTWHAFVRTKDWVAPWKAPGAPGKFQVLVNGTALPKTLGTEGAEWHWQKAGAVKISKTSAEIALHDLSGFDGRCDAILFSRDPGFSPDNSSGIMPAWRRKMLGLPEQPVNPGKFDLVVVGGGYAGTCAAISAARMGIKVALIQNRGVLGGNGSSEVRVWAMGNTPGGLYPVGDIVRELEDDAKKSPGTFEEFEDAKKEKIARAEDNLALFLHHHAYDVETTGNKITAVHAFDVRSGELKVFRAPLFSDCTGHGYIAMKAGADSNMMPKGRMGMSNMWSWHDTGSPVTFPETPWALDLDESGFPYPRKHHAQWFWESGFDKHPLKDLELIRDWNLRASYGAWNAIKNRGAYAKDDETGKKHANAKLEWLAYVGGTRETQQFYGDVILTEPMILEKKTFPDAAVLSTWSIDLHYPKQQYLGKYADNPFISIAVHGKGVDRSVGYAVPYRCFYSRNINNLFLAGRNVSVTHKALGTVRVMKTCGMMGVVVGKAAAICTQNHCGPREVYTNYLDDLIGLMKLPGSSRRAKLDDTMVVGPFLPPPEPRRKVSNKGIDPRTLPGLVVDNRKAKLSGNWGESTTHAGFIDREYLYSSSGECTAVFPIKVPTTAVYDLRLTWNSSKSRCTNVPVVIVHGAGTTELVVNMSVPPKGTKGLQSLGEFLFNAKKPGSLTLSNKGVKGHVIADAVQLVPLK